MNLLRWAGRINKHDTERFWIETVWLSRRIQADDELLTGLQMHAIELVDK